MANEFKRVGKHTVIYGAGLMLGQMTAFLLLPLYTRFLTPSDYGVLELLGMTIDVISMIVGVGLGAAVYKFYYDAQTHAERRQVLSTFMLGSVALAFVATAAGLLLAPNLNELVFPGSDNTLYFRVFFLTYFFQTVAAPGLLILRLQDRSISFVVVNLVKLLCSVGLNVLFVVHLGMGLEGVLLSTVLVSGTMAVGLGTYMFYHSGVAFSAADFARMARFGAPMIVVSLSSFVLTFSDRYFLNHYTGADAVGIYGLAYRFSFVLSSLTVLPFQQVWEPRRFEVANRPDAASVFSRMFFYSSAILVLGAAGMVALIKDVLAIMVTPAFAAAHRVLPLILIATILQQWASYIALGLYIRNRTDLLAWASFGSVAVALVLNAVLIPHYGMMGAAWATVGAYMVRFIVTYAASQRHYPLEYPWPRVGALVAMFCGVWMMRGLVTSASLLVSLPLSVLLGCGAIFACYGILNHAERTALRDFLTAIRLRKVQGSRGVPQSV